MRGGISHHGRAQHSRISSMTRLYVIEKASAARLGLINVNCPVYETYSQD